MDTILDALPTTRRSLHAVAESLLAGHQHRVAGTIRLAVEHPGFTTLPLPGQPSLLAVRGTDLVVTAADGETVLPLTGTLDDLAAAAGVAFGAPLDVYAGGLGAMGSDDVVVDPAAARTLMRAFDLGDAAMRRFGAAHRAGTALVPVLWPEHFDLGISLDEVNYGLSLGDDEIAEPYAYVGPWAARSGSFWSHRFGAGRPVAGLDVDDVVDFYESGRAAAAQDPLAGA